jgi:hypothetical protein
VLDFLRAIRAFLPYFAEINSKSVLSDVYKGTFAVWFPFLGQWIPNGFVVMMFWCEKQHLFCVLVRKTPI